MRSRLRYGDRRLRFEIRTDAFQAALTNFNRDAEAFAASLSDKLHREFAFRYLDYLQNIAREAKPPKPNDFGLGPASRLIRAELDRLFDVSFLSTGAIMAEAFSTL